MMLLGNMDDVCSYRLSSKIGVGRFRRLSVHVRESREQAKNTTSEPPGNKKNRESQLNPHPNY